MSRRTSELDAPVPRYFFHQRGPEPGQYIPDTNGHVLPDARSAKAAAAETLQRLSRTDPHMLSEPWIFEVIDEDGQLAVIFPFAQRKSGSDKAEGNPTIVPLCPENSALLWAAPIGRDLPS